VVGTGGLVETGAGLLNLTTNSYAGNTTVSNGTLVLNFPTLATNSTVTVNTNAALGTNGILNLNFTGTNTIAALVLGGVSKPAGVYSATTDPLYITGTGSLLVPSAIVPLPPRPTFSRITFSGGNIIITGTNNNGPGGTWALLGTNNLASPLTNWPVITNATFGSDGNITLTNAVGTNREFFILRVP
jgi:autotransporter-associated beta strand protein